MNNEMWQSRWEKPSEARDYRVARAEWVKLVDGTWALEAAGTVPGRTYLRVTITSTRIP